MVLYQHSAERIVLPAAARSLSAYASQVISYAYFPMHTLHHGISGTDQASAGTRVQRAGRRVASALSPYAYWLVESGTDAEWY
eukprot:2741270-Rhodomonas_salina.6